MLVACGQIVDAGFDVALDRPPAPVEMGRDAANDGHDSTALGGRAGAADSDVERDAGRATNTAPEARDGTLVVVEGATKRSPPPSFDADDDARQHRIIERAKLGDVTIDSATGDFVYTSWQGYYGDDSFTYQVNDGRLDANEVGTIKVTVVARGPLAAESGPVVEFPTPPALWIGQALDIEGDTAVMSAWEKDLSLIYVLRRDARGSWTVRQRIDEGLTRGFIYDVDVALSGDWMAVAVMGHGSVDGGPLYFYKRPSNNADFELEQQSNINDSPRGDETAWQIALDGDLAVVGAPDYDGETPGDAGLRGIGAVYVYRRLDDAWTREQKIVSPSPKEELYFGRRLGIANGALVATSAAPSSATLYVFNQGAGSWTRDSWFAAGPEPIYGSVGNTVAAHGDKILISPGVLSEVYAYGRNGSGWQAHGSLFRPADDDFIEEFGPTVALHDDTAIVTGRLHNDAGVAYVYHYSFAIADSGWRYSGRRLTGAKPGKNGLGYSAAFDGTTAVLTAPDDSNTRGAIYFFGIEPAGTN
jgi:hypothetical protein